eukprot:1628218-Ditylum_brightwellii.AAC.1
MEVAVNSWTSKGKQVGSQETGVVLQYYLQCDCVLPVSADLVGGVAGVEKYRMCTFFGEMGAIGIDNYFSVLAIM